MEKVTKQNMLKYLEMREEYKQTHNKELLKEINYNVNTDLLFDKFIIKMAVINNESV